MNVIVIYYCMQPISCQVKECYPSNLTGTKPQLILVTVMLLVLPLKVCNIACIDNCNQFQSYSSFPALRCCSNC